MSREHPEVGDMVINVRSGKVGFLSEIGQNDEALIQFGASGPFKLVPYNNLLRATAQEIIAAGLAGVGCNQADEVTDAIGEK